jgi:hypothetical protein
MLGKLFHMNLNVLDDSIIVMASYDGYRGARAGVAKDMKSKIFLAT